MFYFTLKKKPTDGTIHIFHSFDNTKKYRKKLIYAAMKIFSHNIPIIYKNESKGKEKRKEEIYHNVRAKGQKT